MKSLRHVDITMKYISEAKIYYREGISRPIHLVKPKDTINIQMSIGHEDAPNLNLSRREIERLIGQDELKRILKDLRDRGIHVIEHKHYNPNIQDERIYVPGNTWIPLSDTEYILSSLYVLSKIYRELLLKIGIELSGEEQLFNPMFGYVGKVNDTDYYLVLPMFLDGEFVFKHNLSSNLNLRSVNHIDIRGLVGSNFSLGKIKNFGSIQGPNISDYLLKVEKIMSVGFTGIELEGMLQNDSRDTFFGKTKNGFMIKTRNQLRAFDSRIKPAQDITHVDPKQNISIKIRDSYMSVKWKNRDPIVDGEDYET